MKTNLIDTPQATAHTLQSFKRGDPVALLGAGLKPKILVLWPHANETLGPRVGYALHRKYPRLLDHVDYMCGNPEAIRESLADPQYQKEFRRYTKDGSDLNRSYAVNGAVMTYEERRAREILEHIQSNDYDFVLDLHTSTTAVGGCILVSDEYVESEAVSKIIAASPIRRVVVLPQAIAKDGLIGNVPNAVSIEYHRPRAARLGVAETIRTINALIKPSAVNDSVEKTYYYVTDFIHKTHDPGLGTKNFVMCKDGYYPVLFGDNSYRTDVTKKYLGFAATKRVRRLP